jgi:hypothetical protein
MEECSNGKGKLAETCEEGQGPRRAVKPMMMIMMKCTYLQMKSGKLQ